MTLSEVLLFYYQMKTIVQQTEIYNHERNIQDKV